jgi:cell division protein FtsB
MARSGSLGAHSSPPVAGSLARVRWDRVGRIALLGMLLALLYLYGSAGVRLFDTWREARGDRSQLAGLEHEHVQLARRHESLARSGTVEEEARSLGMMKAGEQPYVISGLPNN